jgi:hypothetical protein
MKKILLTTAFFAFALAANAQVGIGTPEPHESAALDITAGKKGLLIPRIALNSLTDASLDGDEPNSLLIYNTNVFPVAPATPEVTPGFYYWLDGHWERIVNQQQLDDVINNLYQDLANIHELINYIAPTNPDAPTPVTLTHHTLVWDEVSETFKFVKHDGDQYYTTDIDLLSLVQDLETNTRIEDASTGTAAAGDLEIIFSYEHELHLKDPANHDADLMNITQAIINSIEGNTDLQETIINLFEGGASVFYGTANGAFATPVLYYLLGGVPTRIDTAVVLDGIKAASDAQIREIKDELGNNYNSIVYTGDTWVDNKKIYRGVYNATVVGKTAKLLNAINLDPNDDFSAIGKIISIKLYYDDTLFNTTTTGASLVGENLNFFIGSGNMYTVLDENNMLFKVVVEFSADE